MPPMSTQTVIVTEITDALPKMVIAMDALILRGDVSWIAMILKFVLTLRSILDGVKPHSLILLIIQKNDIDLELLAMSCSNSIIYSWYINTVTVYLVDIQ